MTEALTPQAQAMCMEAVPLVDRLAKMFASRFAAIMVEDLRSTGYEAVVRASPRYDPTKGTVTGFLLAAAKSAMRHLCRDERSVSIREQGALDSATQRDFDEERVEERSLDQVLEITEEDERADVVRDVRLRAAMHASSMLLAEQGDAEENHLDQQARALGYQIVRSVAAGFGEPERTYFVSFFDEEKTLDEIGAKLGVSKKTVQRIGGRVKQRLDEALRANHVL